MVAHPCCCEHCRWRGYNAALNTTESCAGSREGEANSTQPEGEQTPFSWVLLLCRWYGDALKCFGLSMRVFCMRVSL